MSLRRKIKTAIWLMTGRNSYNLMGERSISKNKVNLETWTGTLNLGDYLSGVVFKWMLERKGIQSLDSKKTIHLKAIGSIVHMGCSDATIWGSGIHVMGGFLKIAKGTFYRRKFDIRAVRGPITKECLSSAGYDCDNCVCGDPGVLLPLIYGGGLFK